MEYRACKRMNLKPTPRTRPRLTPLYSVPTSLSTGRAWVCSSVAIFEDIRQTSVVVWKFFIKIFNRIFHTMNNAKVGDMVDMAGNRCTIVRIEPTEENNVLVTYQFIKEESVLVSQDFLDSSLINL